MGGRRELAANVSDIFDDVSAGIALTVIVFIVAVVASPLAGIGVLFAEWMLVLLLVPIAVAYRIVFRRPWHVYAESADGHDHPVTSVVGWHESQRVIDQAAGEIKAAGSPQSGTWLRLDQQLEPAQ